MLKICLVFVLFVNTFNVFSDELSLVINGKSIHDSNTNNYNEDNWGLGFEYDFKPDDKWIPFVAGSSFKDSNDQTSNYLGGGYKYRFPLDNDKQGWRFDLGIIGFMMTRHDYKNNSAFFGAIPFVSIGTGSVMVNVTYIPKVTPKTVGLFYFQLKFKLAEFD